MLDSRSRSVKSRIIAKNPIKLWATKSARLDRQWRNQKKRKTYPTHDVSNHKLQVQNLIFFILNYSLRLFTTSRLFDFLQG